MIASLRGPSRPAVEHPLILAVARVDPSPARPDADPLLLGRFQSAAAPRSEPQSRGAVRAVPAEAARQLGADGGPRRGGRGRPRWRRPGPAGVSQPA